MSVNSFRSDDEESFAVSDVDMIEAQDRKTGTKPGGQKRVCEKKNNGKKSKKNVSYRDKIGKMMKDHKIALEVRNSMSIRQDDGILIVKAPADEKSTDYWTLSHYKTKNIEHVDSKDRWKHAECSMKLSITDQAKDQAISSELNELVQTLFDRFMKDSKKKITRI
ncbi:uncharacterized protein LOC132931228 [Rhopalosiphum padi]|uniref:uncharacterized protein LOC132922376 n=3 Tax=Rhopalosiphum padi TaxID=40932 RepID=UPI00298DCA5E|nr:uncharacterized protein LOC132922376 [Rhopalosiphum padi]XP_060842081.1 uncharacterized protein LOC132922530 [Rhopalosiphum padi]XP_060845350.1 uncharacterized protein LOC132924928 [Rhopalosiphum padi]XP_060845467.1 uncharacterized protein LOC132925057 [Rhopalosiphum padi]XP_060846607.1 uncharacterized protein LOC132926278 [Rhopalosiphum padi]XP_060847000.1 uncharacterized protein LOC132926643 [Rhopalosiphum padi]XP_060847733.1 uncharacterized protein LOC132927251 [Rhopalosiphum padi]XP_0